MNGKTQIWSMIRREAQARDWLVRRRLAEARLVADLRALYGLGAVSEGSSRPSRAASGKRIISV